MNTQNFETSSDGKAWKCGFLIFTDLGKIPNGVTHKYEIRSSVDIGTVLGWVEWKPGWRRYTFRPITAVCTWFDFSCLTIIAEFVKLRTDERKALWGPQGRLADR